MPADLRRRPPFLRALGSNEPPELLETDGCEWKRCEVFKHDSWAATALYEAGQKSIVVKFNRMHPIFILPMCWLGRCLASREARAYSLLAGLPGVPARCGTVFVGGHPWRTAFAHHFIPGHPLAKHEKPGSNFFDQLEILVRAMHARDMAYIDLNKRENVIVSDEGIPVLVDFQIHFLPWKHIKKMPAVRWFTRQLQAADLYHLQKLRMYHTVCPEAAAQMPVPWSSKFWRIVYVHPVQWVRRRLLIMLRIRSGEGLACSEVEPEKAVRLANAGQCPKDANS